MKKNLLISFLIFTLFFSCFRGKKEIVKCVVISCDKITPVSVHDDINRPLGYRIKTSCERSFKSVIKYKEGDTIEVTKITY
jgi:hypothetical protein